MEFIFLIKSERRDLGVRTSTMHHVLHVLGSLLCDIATVLGLLLAVLCCKFHCAPLL